MKNYVKLLELVGFIYKLAHIIAYLIHVLAIIEFEYYGYENTWLHQAEAYDSPYWERYLR